MEAGGKKFRNHTRTTNSMEKGKGQSSSVNKTKGKGKGKNQIKNQSKGKKKGKQKSTKGKGNDKGKDQGNPPKGKGKTSGKVRGKTKAKKKRKFHLSTITEGTTRAFPVQRSCFLMAWQRDHEARNLKTIDETGNIGGAKFQSALTLL